MKGKGITLRKRRKVLVVFFALFFFWLFENFKIVVSVTTISSPKIRSTVTIVQISDLHGYSFGLDNNYLLRAIEKQQPDIVAVTGDLFNRGDNRGKAKALNLIKVLSEEYPVYYVRGEHEGSSSVDDIGDAGATVLEYERVDVKVGETPISIYGCPTTGYYSSADNVLEAIKVEESNNYNILLAHIFYEEVFDKWKGDLILSGDTHGGSIRLPFLGPLKYNGITLPKLSYNGPVYDKGLFNLGDKYLYVSPGLGNFPLPLRLFNHPELTVIKLVSSTQGS
ncbi:phosphoesterase [Coprothermobacter proteolyticus DSM 5265]|nr:phosphoesterase [Coprothermobacter proteolyticus DSM 5265]